MEHNKKAPGLLQDHLLVQPHLHISCSVGTASVSSVEEDPSKTQITFKDTNYLQRHKLPSKTQITSKDINYTFPRQKIIVVRIYNPRHVGWRSRGTMAFNSGTKSNMSFTGWLSNSCPSSMLSKSSGMLSASSFAPRDLSRTFSLSGDLINFDCTHNFSCFTALKYFKLDLFLL